MVGPMLLANPTDERLRELERIAAQEGYNEGDELHVRLIAERYRAGMIPDRHASMSAGLGYVPAQLAGLGDTWVSYHPQVRSASYLRDVAPWTCVAWIYDLCASLFPQLLDYFERIDDEQRAYGVARGLRHAEAVMAWANGEVSRKPPRFSLTVESYERTVRRLDESIHTRSAKTRSERIFHAYGDWRDAYTAHRLVTTDLDRSESVTRIRQDAISVAMEALARVLLIPPPTIKLKNPQPLQNRAPGYQSYAWTTQDWRAVKVSGNTITYAKKCGAEGTRTPSGKPRLCLPLYVIQQLMKSKQGKKILKDQAMKKLRAKKGQRVPWHPRIRELHARLEERTEKDDPRKGSRARSNPFPHWGI